MESAQARPAYLHNASARRRRRGRGCRDQDERDGGADGRRRAPTHLAPPSFGTRVGPARHIRPLSPHRVSSLTENRAPVRVTASSPVGLRVRRAWRFLRSKGGDPLPFLEGVHPYHGTSAASRGNPRQRFLPLSASFRTVDFATGCRRLRPLGSIKAPSFVCCPDNRLSPIVERPRARASASKAAVVSGGGVEALRSVGRRHGSGWRGTAVAGARVRAARGRRRRDRRSSVRRARAHGSRCGWSRAGRR
jgi:hypothetical protein